jgi:hypothetical protein
VSRGGGGGSLLPIVGLVVAFIFLGPMLAGMFKTSAGQVFLTLAPIVGPILGVVLAVLLVRYYWSRS